MLHHSPNPRIGRLTPLDQALERLTSLTTKIDARERPISRAVGAVLAADIIAPAHLPASPVAYADGWAVNASEVVGASAYSAAILAPPPVWVEADDRMPDGADAVLPEDAVMAVAPGMSEASMSIAPGEGVRNTGQDVAAGTLLMAEGTRIAPRHVGILRACGFETAMVRTPRVRLVVATTAAARKADMVRMWLEGAGAEILELLSAPGDREKLAACYSMPGADLVISLGGTGQGRGDCAVAALGDVGTVDFQGVALRPGGTASFGRAGGVPVLLLPGRVDGVIAGVLVLASTLLTHISGLSRPDWHAPSRLSDKASSVIGFTELFLGVPEGDLIRPIPLDEASFDALARAVGWFTVPPGSEGFAAGDTVHLRPFQPR